MVGRYFSDDLSCVAVSDLVITLDFVEQNSMRFTRITASAGLPL